MYNPCLECLNRYGRSYAEDCDNKCLYAQAVSKLLPHGGVDKVLEVLKGEAFPVIFLDKEHIENTYKIVCAAKDGYI
jgi:hypothetical protein